MQLNEKLNALGLYFVASLTHKTLLTTFATEIALTLHGGTRSLEYCTFYFGTSHFAIKQRCLHTLKKSHSLFTHQVSETEL